MIDMRQGLKGENEVTSHPTSALVCMQCSIDKCPSVHNTSALMHACSAHECPSVRAVQYMRVPLGCLSRVSSAICM